MQRRLQFLTLASVTLLISLSFPLSPGSINLGGGVVLAQAQTTQDRNDEALRLYQEGNRLLNISRFREALEIFQQVLVIVREIGDRQGEGVTLAGIGAVYRNLGQYPLALEYYQQALAISREVGDRAGEGITLNKIGQVYLNLGQYPLALEYLNQALAIYKEVGDRAGEGITLNDIGLVYRNLGQYPRALEYLNQALTIYKQVGDRGWEGTTLNNIGGVYRNLGQYPLALEYYQQALAISKEVSDRAGEGTTLNNIGQVYRNLGQYPLALEYLNQALAISREVGDREGETTTLNDIGLVYDNLGQYPRALEYLNQALTIYKQVGNRGWEGTTLNNIGGVYRNLGQYPLALEYYQQALAISKEVGDRAGEGVTLNNIGLVYDNLGQYPRALEFYQQALAIRKEVSDRAGEGTTLNNIGRVYNNLGQYAKALEFYQQALAITKEVGNRAGEGATLNNIGGVYHDLEQYPKALEYLNQALAISKEVGNRAGEGTILSNMGITYYYLNQYDNAEKTLFAAIEVLESLRDTKLTDDQKISIFETQADTYRWLQLTLIAQNKINPALEIAERSRARAFVDLLYSRFSQNPNNQQKAPFLTIQQIQQIAKQQNATIVQYSTVWDDLLYIWVIKPTGEIAFKQVDLRSLDTTLENVAERARVFAATGRESTPDKPIASANNRTRSGIVAPRNIQFNQEAADSQTKPITYYPVSNRTLKQVYDLLIKPIANELPTDPNERVIFIPQASLFRVPFPALFDENGKYLIQKHTILTAPSIQTLDLTHKQKGRRAEEILIVGNPTMPFTQDNPTQRYRELPFALEEAKEIATLLNSKYITGNQATKANVIQQMRTARIIHLATHGLLNDKQALQSSIALAPSGQDNGLLTADEIFDLKLNADLVVLSACDTGRGEITGDGVIGLSRALISAGASSVIVSLWPVWDDSTKLLMTQFYRNLQQNPDKAKALRDAMLSVMKSKPAPQHWAAFTIIGEAQ